MEVLIDEPQREPWLEKKTKRRLGFLLFLIVLFHLMKHFDSVLKVYKLFYFKCVSPLLTIASTEFKVAYVMVLAVLIIKLLGAFTSFKIKKLANSLLRFVSGLTATFLILWGFNYSRADLTENPNPEDVSDLFQIVVEETEILISASISDVKSTGAFTFESNAKLKQGLKSVTEELFPLAKVNPRPQPVIKDGTLRKMGIGGIFFPFTHQPLYDNSAPKITKWFTYSHEYYHSVSVTGEDECNALAFYTLIKIGEDRFKMSAYLDVLRTCANLMGYSREELKTQVGEKTYELLEYIWEDQGKYVTSFHSVSHASNDFYLKSLGSEEGVSAYNGYLKFLIIEHGKITLYSEREKVIQI